MGQKLNLPFPTSRKIDLKDLKTTLAEPARFTLFVLFNLKYDESKANVGNSGAKIQKFKGPKALIL